MNDARYKWLLYIIVTTIVLTIAVQCYWNYKNYLLNKQNFINQVQISLDNALDTYYANLAESNQMTFVEIKHDDTLRLSFNQKLNRINSDSIIDIFINQSIFENEKPIRFTETIDFGSGFTEAEFKLKTKGIKVLQGKESADSLKLIKGITAIYISIHRDTLDFSKLNPLIVTEFKRKNFDIPHTLKLYKNDSVLDQYNTEKIRSGFLITTAKSTFLKHDEMLEMSYPNATRIILKQGLSGILLSLLLSLVIISSLLYLLKIIKHQKQLAEVKNDLINNITHEFKTPIATISVALESIKNFNVIDDKEKTKTYLDISNEQLNKLNIMVEKLLETATLDSDSLSLDKEEINLVDFINNLVEKQNFTLKGNAMTFTHSHSIIPAHIDVFHFENAINNIIDNAIKYGGKTISVELNKTKNGIEISISDNGNTITKANKDKVFKKFYRIPKGNTHDVKGFGIGLYYTKKIIEKHGGTIQLDLEQNFTTFKITLPNDY